MFLDQKTNYSFCTRTGLITIFMFNRKNKIQFLVCFSFSCRNYKTNYLKDQNYLYASMVNTLFKSELVSSHMRLSAIQWSRRHQYSAVQETANVFWCLYYRILLLYLFCSYSQYKNKTYIVLIIICSYLQYDTYYQKQWSWRDLLESFQTSFINSLKIVKADVKFKQRPWEINVKDFIVCSVGRTIPIIWNTISCSN